MNRRRKKTLLHLLCLRLESTLTRPADGGRCPGRTEETSSTLGATYSARIGYMEWYLLGITLMTEGSRIQSSNLLRLHAPLFSDDIYFILVSINTARGYRYLKQAQVAATPAFDSGFSSNSVNWQI